MAMYDHFTYWLVVYATPSEYIKIQCNDWRELNKTAEMTVELGVPEGLGLFVIEIDPETDIEKAIRLEIISHLCDLFGWDRVMGMIRNIHPAISMN